MVSAFWETIWKHTRTREHKTLRRVRKKNKDNRKTISITEFTRICVNLCYDALLYCYWENCQRLRHSFKKAKDLKISQSIQQCTKSRFKIRIPKLLQNKFVFIFLSKFLKNAEIASKGHFPFNETTSPVAQQKYEN